MAISSEALGMVETKGLIGSVEAADAMVKAANDGPSASLGGLPSRAVRPDSARNDAEAEDAHERLAGRRLVTPVAPSAVPIHRKGLDAAVTHSPVQDHPATARGLLAAMEEISQVRQGPAHDHEIAGHGPHPETGRPATRPPPVACPAPARRHSYFAHPFAPMMPLTLRGCQSALSTPSFPPRGPGGPRRGRRPFLTRRAPLWIVPGMCPHPCHRASRPPAAVPEGRGPAHGRRVPLANR